LGEVVVWMSISIDGYMEGPERQIDWHAVDEELHTYFNDRIRQAGALLGGRVTHQLMESFWPEADQDPEIPQVMKEFAGIWRDKPKIVYSTTLEEAGWNTTIVREVVPGEVRALKSVYEGDLIVGGGRLATSFAERDLIDEYCIYIHPVILGDGVSLLDAPYRPVQLTLIETRVFGNGVVMLRYQRPKG
jgi:dihydrofolate reductase